MWILRLNAPEAWGAVLDDHFLVDKSWYTPRRGNVLVLAEGAGGHGCRKYDAIVGVTRIIYCIRHTFSQRCQHWYDSSLYYEWCLKGVMQLPPYVFQPVHRAPLFWAAVDHLYPEIGDLESEQTVCG